MADQKWYRCELRSRDGDEVLGYFITQAGCADGEGDSAAGVYYDLFDHASAGEDDCLPALEEVVECEDPTIPNDYERTAALRARVVELLRSLEIVEGRANELAEQVSRKGENPHLLARIHELTEDKRVREALVRAAMELLDRTSL
jgi:hypothetical protein